jgi:hypothetical protein
VGFVVRSGGGPSNILFDRSLHDKDECLESKYMYTFNKYICTLAMGIPTRLDFK